MAVGIYVRVSTASQTDNTSLDEQIRLCTDKARKMGFVDSQILLYKEEGRSGEEIETRIQLSKLREDVASGRVSAVICTHPDRFSRDLTDKLIACREFEKNGAKLYFTDTDFTDSPEGQLFFNIMSAIASYELSLIRKRTIRGRLAKVKNEKKIMPMRSAPFGYDKTEDGQLIVNEREKQYVQMIYEWYLFEKLTMREIGERLYKLGVRPKRRESRHWSASSIRRILTSEIYLGKYYYNRRATEKVRGQLTAGGNPKKTYTYRPASEWLQIEVPPMINEELWNMAQLQRQANRKYRHVGNKKHEYLLQTIVKCGHCGRTYQATTYRGRANRAGEQETYRCYRCPNKFPKKYGPEVAKCQVPSVRAEQLEQYLWQQITRILVQPERLMRRMKAKAKQSLSRVQARLAQLETDVSKYMLSLEKVERAIFEADNQAEIDRLEKYRTDYKQTITSLQVEITACQQEMQAIQSGQLNAEQITQVALALREKLNTADAIPFEVKRNIILMLFDEINIRFAQERKLILTSQGLFDQLYRENIDSGVCIQPEEV